MFKQKFEQELKKLIHFAYINNKEKKKKFKSFA